MKKILKIISCIIFLSILLFVSFYYTFNLFNPHLTVKYMGFKPYIVLSESMEPDLKVGDILFATVKNIADVETGEIVVFKPENELVIAHRVGKKYYGDDAKVVLRTVANNIRKDKDTWVKNTEKQLDKWPITCKNYIGIVKFRIPYLGKIFLFVKSKEGIVTILSLIVLLLIFRQLLNRINYSDEYKISGEDKEALDLEIKRRANESKRKSIIEKSRKERQKINKEEGDSTGKEVSPLEEKDMVTEKEITIEKTNVNKTNIETSYRKNKRNYEG